ncbi:hypothetical protein UFOVP457_60 [uncultured Caudovirales phage]|uniref:Uncharacterized protein n=1 Tax=uncultured Caudovirales phage TaxID=2100421 RepID=A0A6J5MCA9_9CAUD|nr:hypothetical protein UFOVP457_60 [uncultured Caudovirales phage]
MRTLDRSRWLVAESKDAIDIIQAEMDKQGVTYAKQLEGKKIAMLIALNKPYSNGHQDFDKIIYRRFN